MASDSRRWLHAVGIAITVSISFYVILELEYPRVGFIRLDGIDRTLVELRGTMN